MRFSRRQRQALLWWNNSRHDGIICHGAVRSGKTTACALGFVLWATCSFDRRDFAICGKSRAAVRRNLVAPTLDLLRRFGFTVEEHISSASFTVRFGGRSNIFRLFGGMNEASAALIQGITLAGVLFDEVTLMPQSFVSQAMARCSVDGSKVWFCCNPDSPAHWFKREYVDRAEERRLKVLHFAMSDNPSLSRETLAKYHRQFAGKFFRRYVLGCWESPDDLVYDFMEDGQLAAEPPPEPHERYVISVDYGTANPSSFGLWGLKNNVWWRIREFYHDGRAKGSLTDEEYADRLDALKAGCTAVLKRELINGYNMGGYLHNAKLVDALMNARDELPGLGFLRVTSPAETYECGKGCVPTIKSIAYTCNALTEAQR